MTLRVLHCIYDDPANPWVAGGGAVRVREMYRRLASELRVTVASGNYPGAVDGEVEGVRYVRLGAEWPYAWSRLSYARAATGLLRRGDYDVAIFDFSVYTPLRLPANGRVAATVHHVTAPTARDRWGRVIGGVVAAQERRMLRQTRWFTATSVATREILERMVPPGSTVRLIEAGVPDELFTLPRAESDYLLFFGRLDWFQKGLDVLLAATAILVGDRPALRLRIAGRGKDVERVRSAARELGITDHIEILGSVTEEARRELFAGARVLLMPSRFEGFGMVAAEAMAAGVPLVAAAAGSLPEVVDAPRGGVLVPPEDAEALAAAVGRLLDDESLRSGLSATARESAERYRWERIARLHLEFIEDLHRDASGIASPKR